MDEYEELTQEEMDAADRRDSVLGWASVAIGIALAAAVMMGWVI
jgi:hypothetical protein